MGMLAFEGAFYGSILVGQGFNPLCHGMEPFVNICVTFSQTIQSQG
jgi:hypothetical protein